MAAPPQSSNQMTQSIESDQSEDEEMSAFVDEVDDESISDPHKSSQDCHKQKQATLAALEDAVEDNELSPEHLVEKQHVTYFACIKNNDINR